VTNVRRILVQLIKICVLLGIIWLAFELYDHFRPVNDYNLEAQGHYYTYHFPDSIRREIARISNDEVKENFRCFSERNSILTVILKNRDDRDISKIHIEVPFKGQFQVVKNEKVVSMSDFDGRILVGPMQAGGETRIIAWTDSWKEAPKGRYDKRYRVTHPEGLFYIDFPIEVRGFLATIIDYGIANMFILTSVFLLILTSFTIIIMLVMRRD